jgi:hypothetical protein
MPRTVTRRAAALLIAAIAVAACQSGNGATSSPGESLAGPGALSTPQPATQAPLPTIDAGFSFELPSQDKELEAMLPDEIAGGTVGKSSMTGSSLVGASDSALSKALQGLGKTPDDLSAAFGTGGGVSVSVYRLKGVDAATLLVAFVALLDPGETPTVTDATVGGKEVKQVVTGGSTSYVYTKDDVLFTIAPIGTGTDADAAIAEAISKLP